MENQRFNKILEKTLRWEGGLSNDPDDKGGLTRFGISKAAWPDLDIQNLTLNDAKEIYYSHYWQKPRISSINNDALAGTVFDFGVTAGPGTAIKYLQQAANYLGAGLATDGALGPLTLNYVNGFKYQAALFMAFKTLTGNHYIDIVKAKPSQQKYLAGWLNRLAE